jgi:lysophospholipase L1-like esterase
MAREPTSRPTPRSAHRERLRRAVSRIALASGAVALALGALELALRAGSTQGAEPRDGATRVAAGIPDEALYVRTPEGGLALRPSARVVIRGHAVSGRTIEIRTNARGFRGGELEPRSAGRRRIVALGDSVTFGDYVEEGETWPAALERALAARGVRAEVVNAGVGSIGVADMGPLLAGPVRAVDPDLVLVALYLNDAQRSLFVAPPPRWVRRSRLLALVSARVARLRAEQEWHALLESRRGERERFLATHPTDDRADWRDDPRGFDREVAAAFADWGYAWSEGAWREIERGVASLREVARAHGLRLAVVLFPVRHQVESRALRSEPQRAFAAAMDRLGLPHGDPLLALRRMATSTTGSLFYDHCHYTPAGNAAVAEALADFVARLTEE